MYANDVVVLSNSIEGAQRAIKGVYDWGQRFGMELGRDKCGVLLWKGSQAAPRKRCRVLDLEDDDELPLDREELELAHKATVYGMPEGPIPMVDAYKYLGITFDGRLGDPRKVVVGERSMELDFAKMQAKKGMRQLHILRPFLTDRFCPIHLKVALVRNLIYPTMLYGLEFIGFQKLHLDPLQRVINIAAKWMVGLHRSNTSTDAFSLCYELGLPLISLEMSSMRARLGIKLDARPPLKTWIQELWDNPATYPTRHLTWVTQTKKWLNQVEKEKHKYAQLFLPDEGAYYLQGRRIVDDDDAVIFEYIEDGDLQGFDHVEGYTAALLRHWAQIGHCLEMRVRSNAYRTGFIERLMAEMTDEFADGAPVEMPLLDMQKGIYDTEWSPGSEFGLMGEMLGVPKGRRGVEVKRLLLVRHVVLEWLMAAQHTVSWAVYNSYFYGISRGFLWEALNRTDLAEGVRWLVLARTKAFPQVERAWQRITRSGKRPGFSQGECPLCCEFLAPGLDVQHLLVSCKAHQVQSCRSKYLEQNIAYLDCLKAWLWESAPNALSDKWGGWTRPSFRKEWYASTS
jgi:hypothetical protein